MPPGTCCNTFRQEWHKKMQNITNKQDDSENHFNTNAEYKEQKTFAVVTPQTLLFFSQFCYLLLPHISYTYFYKHSFKFPGLQP